MELLAPAGSNESMIAAVQAGANAIYLGGKKFGARHYASNFSTEEMKEAVEYCHLRNVSVYVTVNTLIHDAELNSLEIYLKELSQIGVDGIIVQDIAVAKIARKIGTNLEIHGSTQMTVHNLSSAIALKDLGFSRIVLARELTIEEIKSICSGLGSDLEVEVFIHGALCISYSGQCLMSSIIGGRSGNRGQCAQPCRLPYQLEKDGKELPLKEGQYLLSPKDLNFSGYLSQLEEAGVVSLKIEGRMKGPEYVATVVNNYRSILDGNQELKKANFEQVFHRGHSKGYLEGLSGREMMSNIRPNNQGEEVGAIKNSRLILDKAVNIGDRLEIRWGTEGREMIEIVESNFGKEMIPKSLIPDDTKVVRVFNAAHSDSMGSFYKNIKHDLQAIPISMVVSGEIGKPLTLTITDNENNVIIVSGEAAAEIPLKLAITDESLHKQLSRLGGTPFGLDKFENQFEGDFAIPLSELNYLRREGIQKLTDLRIDNKIATKKILDDLPIDQISIGKAKRNSQAPKLQVQVANLSQAQSAIRSGANRIYFEGDFTNKLSLACDILGLCKKENIEMVLGFPRILPEEESDLYQGILNSDILKAFSSIQLSSLAFLKEIKDKYPEMKIYGDFSLNVFNQVSTEEYFKLGFDELTLSPELTLKEARYLGDQWGIRLQVFVHGFQEVMISKFCLLGSYLGNIGIGRECSKPCEKGSYVLRDRKDEAFLVHTDQHCRMHLYNGKELSMLSFGKDLISAGAAVWRIDGRFFSNDHLSEIIEIYGRIIESGQSISKSEEVKIIPTQNVTRGHYFRGVK